ncbi:glycosyltransferase [Spongiactinospora sp. TRM90649]|uniref:glycosyltransferase n=1 Tax=Spongiactinospora sp. TRM90649 TaxID=3031114 RepID=UPI0023F914FC|nr:glycosyltransferase [Spongiactinospora sp. TRM90649]MDF5754725.1 glycosyltransferase [Spongiactinospora sp. TRM90649]
MRVLLSTIGSRGEVQPLVALALELRDLGQEVRLCVPPDFRHWIDGLGFPVVPIGPELRSTATPGRARPTPDQLRQLAHGTVAAQFATIPVAAAGCDVIVGAGSLQIAARSIAERMGVPYVHAHFCPITLPSPHHPPPVLGLSGPSGHAPAREVSNPALWAEDAERWNATWRDALNAHRTSAGQAPVTDVRRHLLTDRPLLAADATLGPWPSPADLDVVQTGAWIVRERRPLPIELEAFLADGEPPVYFGFGSARAPEGLAEAMIRAARALGRRAIVSRGWTGLSPVDGEPDCLPIGEVDQQALFPRVAAAVHHGGAGTTTAAALAGAPQVVVPQMFDQPYWAGRVAALGIGVAHPQAVPTAGSLTAALEEALRPGVAARARAVAAMVTTDGASVVARYVLSMASTQRLQAQDTAKQPG